MGNGKIRFCTQVCASKDMAQAMIEKLLASTRAHPRSQFAQVFVQTWTYPNLHFEKVCVSKGTPPVKVCKVLCKQKATPRVARSCFVKEATLALTH